MSILDGLPKDREQGATAALLASQIVSGATKGADLNPRQQSIVDLLNEGLSLADICGITKGERDVLLAQSGRLLQAGNVRGAQDMLINLLQLEPTDHRVSYTLGITFQMQGDFARAGKLFAQAIALDASRQDSYARLGECFMANREDDSARGCFEAARIDLGGGPPRADTRDHAGRMIALLDARAAG